jgi:alkylation response protein AidB-like acyl-CoA dehydrogenase
VSTIFDRLDELSDRTRTEGPWSSGAFAALAQEGVLAALLAADDLAAGVSTEAYALSVFREIACRCMTTALAITQWAAGAAILKAAGRPDLVEGLATGERTVTIGISQLTTSRRHLAKPPVLASRGSDGWVVNGSCPWVTGGDTVDFIVTGAVTTTDHGQDGAFFVIDRRSEGVFVEPPLRLIALSGSRTSMVRLNQARPLAVIPAEGATGAGGLPTTAVAVGAALGSVDLLRQLAAEAPGRPDLAAAADRLAAQCRAIVDRLDRPEELTLAARHELRGVANDLVARAAQAALVAAKGAGFIEGHPAGRAVCEAQFFRVWSSPPAIVEHAMRELTGPA